jgi:hypothetical protein
VTCGAFFEGAAASAKRTWDPFRAGVPRRGGSREALPIILPRTKDTPQVMMELILLSLLLLLLLLFANTVPGIK